MTTSEWIGLVALYLSSSLSAAAGVGGGAVNVAIFYMIMQFTFRDAVVYSLATLLGKLPETHCTIHADIICYHFGLSVHMWPYR